MVFTGMTLTVDDFAKILQRPSQVAMGFLCQYTVMPLTGYYITKLMCLTPDIAAGVILVSCCPGGTSSNLITLIAKGDVALSGASRDSEIRVEGRGSRIEGSGLRVQD